MLALNYNGDITSKIMIISIIELSRGLIWDGPVEYI